MSHMASAVAGAFWLPGGRSCGRGPVYRALDGRCIRSWACRDQVAELKRDPLGRLRARSPEPKGAFMKDYALGVSEVEGDESRVGWQGGSAARIIFVIEAIGSNAKINVWFAAEWDFEVRACGVRGPSDGWVQYRR